MVNGVMNAFDTATLAVTSLYFLYVSRLWLYLYLFLTLCATIALLILMFVIPNSPKWLLIQGKKSEAIEALNKIAAINGSANRIPIDAEFVECLVI